jgi:GT2 family glycosyltransferase
VDRFISVVVPTFNRRASLTRLLGALAAQTYAASAFEVVVVDDGSTDGTVETLQSLRPAYRLRLVEQPHRGPAAARNLGVEHAAGALIVFLDDDVVPLPGLLTAHANSQRDQTNTVVIGPMSPPRDWPRPAWIRWEEDKLQEQYRALVAGTYACTARQFYTANVSLRRAQFLAAGGFDIRFQRAEDVELGYRLARRGARFVFDPTADVLHYAARTFASWRRTPYQYGCYDALMAREQGRATVANATREFKQRNAVNRAAARVCVGRPILVRAAVLSLSGFVHAADRLGAYRPATLALSGIFNLLYWQGVADELGDAARLWRADAAPVVSPL